MRTWQHIGDAGVDAGLIILADPCYLVRDPGDSRYGPYQDWQQFLAELRKQDAASGLSPLELRDNYQMPGSLGVVVGGFGGDGVYPVYVERDARGRVRAATIRFDGELP